MRAGVRKASSIALGALVLVLLAGCRDVASEAAPEYEPGITRPIKGTELSRVLLKADAARRIGLRTAEVEAEGRRLVVPQSAIWVDEHGSEWVYTNPEPLVFIRAEVDVARYVGTTGAVLSDGPPPGTKVASVGVPELIGTEFGV